MKKILIFFAVYILLSVSSFGESYYFKGCKITENINADYLINFEKNIINAKIVAENGKFQKFEDKILLVTDKKIYSEIIQNQKTKSNYLQYVLDSNSPFSFSKIPSASPSIT